MDVLHKSMINHQSLFVESAVFIRKHCDIKDPQLQKDIDCETGLLLLI